MTADTRLLPDTAMIRAAWEAISGAGETREIRIPSPRRPEGRRPRFYRSQAGWFDDADAVVRAVGNVSGDDAESVYLTVNPTLPELRARANNRLADAKSTTTDDAVTRLAYLFVDIDAQRMAGIPATDEEKVGALAQRDAVAEYLCDFHGWPMPFMVGDSGNGGALLYRIALDNTPDNADVLRRVLESLCAIFPMVDRTTFNPSRIMKLPGTIAAKGDGLPDRPWRRSSAVFDKDAGVVSLAQLEAVAAEHVEAPRPVTRNANGTYNGPPRGWTVEELLSLNNLPIRPRQASYGLAFDLDRCLTSNDHTDGACIIEAHDGRLGYKCQHNSCAGRDWKYLREHGLIQIPVSPQVSLNGQRPKEATDQTNDAPAESNAEPEGNDEPPAFPVDSLPGPVRAFVTQSAAASDIDPAFVALPLLAIAGGLIGPSVRLQLKSNWSVTGQLWLAVVAEPGRGKTPGEQAARRGLEKLQSAAYEEYERELKAYEKDVSDWAALPNDARGPKPETPKLTSYYAADVTMEALVVMLGVRPALVVLRDELVSWVRSCDAYRGGKGGDRAAWLSSWSGVPIKVDRKTGKPAYIENPVVSVAGSIQPDMLPALAEEANRRDGFIERIMFAFPVDHVPAWTEDEVDATVARQVENLYADIVGMTPLESPLRFSREAREAWIEWYSDNTEAQARVSGILGGIYAKLPIQLARLVLVLHVIEAVSSVSPVSSEVKPHTVARAIQLVEYFRAHAHRVVPYFGEAASVIPGLSPEQQQALRFINERGEVKSNDLAEWLGTSQSSAANIIAKLRKKGLVVQASYGVYTPVERHARGFTSDETDESDETATDSTPGPTCRLCGEELLNEKERAAGVCWPCSDPDGRPF